MAAEYNTERTSQWTAQVRDVQISIPKNPGTEVTRRVARMQLVDNAKDSEACVKVTLLNQKRRNPNEPWQDPEFFNAVKLKRGEQIRFHLSAGQAKRLYVALRDMYEVGSKGLPEGRRSLRVVDSNEAVIVTVKEKT